MVHSLRALKAEGDKSGAAANKQASGKLENAPADSASTTTATTPASSDINLNAEAFGSGPSSLGSDCLFSSTEELLDFRSDCFDGSNEPNSQRKATTRKAFSIDDIDDEEIFPSANVVNKARHQHPQPQAEPKHPAKASCWIWAEKQWKAAKWRFNPQTIKSLKMALKRHYMLVLLLCLIVVSCLIASFAISRTLDAIGNDGDNYGDTSKQEGTMSLPQAGVPPVEFEQRYIDLIDMIECGKTFAFTKLRVQVRVPKSSPIYRQHPNMNSGEQRQASEARYFLTRLPDSHNLGATDGIEGEIAFDSSRGTSLSSFDSEHAPIAKDMVGSPIKPVPIAASPAVVDSEPPKVPEDLPVLKRFKRPTREADELASEQAEVPYLDDDIDLQDPLMSAASELRLNLLAINKTVIDCFIVDTEKRQAQKVAFEDKYRQVAVTRKVPFKRMMDTIVACRRLTWANLMANKKKKVAEMFTGQAVRHPAHIESAGSDIVRISTPEAQKQDGPPGSDFLGSLFGGWLGNGQAANNNNKESQEAAEATPVASQRVAAIAGEQKQTEQRADGSYFNVGMSMVNGIVPNTLWCGLGDRAANYSELGAESQVDACCRAHDHCPIRLKPFATDYGLVNWSMSTRSHCDCDLDFNECLNALNSTLSNVIRILYFRLIGLQCIDVEGKRRT